jgi:uncharacterized repeat protein (TIGR03803 family)
MRGRAGANSAGTVFKIIPAGALTTLYSFCSQTDFRGECVDGQYPRAGLIQASDGNFYGTTTGGGDANDLFPDGAGTVFQITPAGALTTLYSFCTMLPLGGGFCLDGDTPEGGLIEAGDGNFYGTAYGGGVNGYGTVFKLSVSVVKPVAATLTVSPSKPSFGSTPVRSYKADPEQLAHELVKASGALFVDRACNRGRKNNRGRFLRGVLRRISLCPADPFAFITSLQREAPVFYAPSIGYYVVTRYADIEAVFLDHETYSAAAAQLPLVPLAPEAAQILNASGTVPQPSMVSLDPPAHTWLRSPTVRAFTPQRHRMSE